MHFSWVRHDLIVCFNYVLGYVLYFCQQFWDFFLVFRTEVYVHTGQHCLYWILGLCVNNLAVRVHRGQGKVQLFTKLDHVHVFTRDLWCADFHPCILNQIIPLHPPRLLLLRNHLPNGLLHNWPPAWPVTFQHQHCLLLAQKYLRRQKSRYTRAYYDYVVNIFVVVFEESTFTYLPALVKFTLALASFARAALVFDEDFLHLSDYLKLGLL